MKPHDVYFNLRTRTWSQRDRKTGRIIAHLTEALVLYVDLVVGAKGNARVRKEEQKNVHAFVRGVVDNTALTEALETHTNNPKWKRLRYNPYFDTTFMCDTLQVKQAEAVLLTKQGLAWALNPK